MGWGGGEGGKGEGGVQEGGRGKGVSFKLNKQH